MMASIPYQPRRSGPLNGTRPISRHGSGPLAQHTPNEERPYVWLHTRPLLTPVQAFHEAARRMSGERGKFEMQTVLVDRSGCHDVLSVVGLHERGCYIRYQNATMVGHTLADLWRKLQMHWPIAVDAQTRWQFQEFPSWDEAAWAEGWQQVQDQARARWAGRP